MKSREVYNRGALGCQWCLLLQVPHLSGRGCGVCVILISRKYLVDRTEFIWNFFVSYYICPVRISLHNAFFFGKRIRTDRIPAEGLSSALKRFVCVQTDHCELGLRVNRLLQHRQWFNKDILSIPLQF